MNLMALTKGLYHIEKLIDEALEERKKHPNLYAKVRLVIAISGTSGSGKSTHAQLLAEYLEEKGFKVKVLEAGEIFRSTAKEMGYDEKSLDKFSESLKSKTKADLDYQIDKRTLMASLGYKPLVNECDAVIIAARLSCLFLSYLKERIDEPMIITVWSKCRIKVAAERIAKDPTRKEFGWKREKIEEYLRRRDEEDKERYLYFYGIQDFIKQSEENADLVVNNELDKLEVQRIIRNFVDKILQQI